MSESEYRTSPGPAEAMHALPPLWMRVVQIFTSPASLFDALDRTPKWVGAALVVIALGVVTSALIPVELIEKMALSNLPPDAPPEQVEAVKQFMGASNVLRWVATVVVPVILILFVSGFILLTWNAILGGEQRFSAILACTAHSYIVWAAGGLATLPLMLARQDLRTTLSLHLLAPFLDHGSYAYRFLAQLSLFGIWTMILLGLAVSRLYPKVSATSACTVMLLAYVAVKAFIAIFAPV